MKRIVLKACAYDPADRYQSANEMLTDLDALGPVARRSEWAASAAVPVPPETPTADETTATVGVFHTSPTASEAPNVSVRPAAGKSASRSEPPAAPAPADPASDDVTVGVFFRPEAPKPPEQLTRKPLEPVTPKPSESPSSTEAEPAPIGKGPISEELKATPKKKKWLYAGMVSAATVFWLLSVLTSFYSPVWLVWLALYSVTLVALCLVFCEGRWLWAVSFAAVVALWFLAFSLSALLWVYLAIAAAAVCLILATGRWSWAAAYAIILFALLRIYPPSYMVDILELLWISIYLAAPAILCLIMFKSGRIAYGKCGADCSWSLSNSGLLVINGSGKMDSWASSNQPWYDKREQIKKLRIRSGVESIGEYAFCGCKNLTEIRIPISVTMIEANAFFSCFGLKNVYYSGDRKALGINYAGNSALTTATFL